MWFRRTDDRPFRPAPFPVYPENTQRLGLERLKRLSAAICLSLVLLPIFAGPSSELAVPVYYARVELAERAPVALELSLPAADYEIAPASLGYFTGSGEFVYSGQVTRGLIYGRRNGEVLVVEIAAPGEAALYLDRQLASIREQVDEVNRCRNRLRLERARQHTGQAESDSGLTALLDQLGPDLDGALPADWNEILPDSNAAADESLRNALTGYARHRVRLKELYYASQSARLKLMLAKFDLQLALARLPQPELDALLVVGDEHQVQALALNGIQRLEEAWSVRSELLARQIAGDRQLLDRADSAVHKGPPDPLQMALGPYAFPGTPPADVAGPESTRTDDGSGWLPADSDAQAAPDPTAEVSAQSSWQADADVIEARLMIAATELSQLKARLSELTAARQHVEEGGLPAWTDLPRHAPQLARLRLNGLEALDAFALVESEARTPPAAAALLLSLAQEFERPGASANRGPAADWQLAPDEVAYGLLAVDRCRLGDPPGGTAEPDPKALHTLVAQLDAMLAFPADYDTAAYNLGYLEFIRWYATLDLPAAPVTAASQDDAAAEDNAESDEGPSEEEAGAGDGADVDELFN